MSLTWLGNLATITRANFLPLTIVIVIANFLAAFYAHRAFNVLSAVMVLAASLLLHASANAFNNYFDYRSMIDSKTVKTSFSGGVEVLVKGQMRGSSALAVAIACLVLAGTIGLYFIIQLCNSLLPLVIYGTLAIVFYSPVLSRIHGLSEIVAGTGFGVMGLGTYVTQSGVIDAVGVALFVPVSILVGMLLFLNEFPDVDADGSAGRKHLVILLGSQRCAVIYVLGALVTYLSIACFVLAGILPAPVLIALLTLPISYRTCRLVLRCHADVEGLVPALGLNVLMILSTVSLLGVGFIIAVLVG